MGGLALKTTTTRRYQAEEFYTLWDEIRNLLLTNTFIASRPLGLTKSYDAKESHGDMDILIGVYTKEEQQDLIKQIEELLQPTEVFRNSNVISMDYKELQIDFCFIDVRLYNLCWHFFAYNDLGGFMGKIAQGLHCKYGQHGLSYTIYNENRSKKLDTIILSTDPYSIFTFLGFNYYVFVHGFRHKGDIFRFIANSHFYRYKAFDGTELNHSQKSRDMSRPMYEELLQYLQKNELIDDSKRERPSLDEVKEYISKFFGIDIVHIEQQAIELDKTRTLVKDKFNGEHIMEQLDIEPGPEVGSLINTFKSNWTDENSYNEFILNNDEELIWDKFKEICQK